MHQAKNKAEVRGNTPPTTRDKQVGFDAEMERVPKLGTLWYDLTSYRDISLNDPLDWKAADWGAAHLAHPPRPDTRPVQACPC